MPTAAISPTSPAVGSFLPRRCGPRFSMALRSAETHTISSVSPLLTKLKHDCATPLPLLQRIAHDMSLAMRTGLAAADDGGSGLPMIPTFVHHLPTGNERGLFYALDFGGTNFRVLRVKLGGKEGRIIATDFDQVSIPQNLMSCTTEELFDFIALRLAKFVREEGDKFHITTGRKRELGFTFSFPVKHTSIDSGFLIKWTKGFAVSGIEGRDVVACLNEAMERQGLDMRVSALVNDGVAALAAAEYWDNDVSIALILGTGTTACYIEHINVIPKLKGYHFPSDRMIINTEWGAFSNGLPLTEYDRDMDAASINPGEQIFEKAVSGKYLGEIARRVLLKMAQVGGLFGNSVPQKLCKPFTIRTPDLSAMQQDQSDDLQVVGSILYDIAGIEANLNVRKTVVEVCDTIIKRGGRLAGAGIVGILQKMEQDSEGAVFGKRTVVAVDGGLYENYPQYRAYLRDSVTELLGFENSSKLVIQHFKDGSGIGAALLAASNSMYKHDS